jgi:hypothetical protein
LFRKSRWVYWFAFRKDIYTVIEVIAVAVETTTWSLMLVPNPIQLFLYEFF